METKYPALKRPKRKLCYLSDNDRPNKKWTGMMSLGDIDRMFDDLEPSDIEEEVVLSSSPLLHMDDTEPPQSDLAPSPVQQQEAQKCHKSPPGSVCHASLIPSNDADVGSPSQGPIKTSSPIEERRAVDVGVTNTEDKAVSPILFLCEDDKELANPSISRTNESVTDDANRKPELKSRITSLRPEETQEVAAHKPEDMKAGEIHTVPLVERPRQMDKSMFTFLQKLRDTQPAPSSSRKPLSPINPPKVSEEDFFILEDEAPLLFRIPRTTSSSRRHSKTSGTILDSEGSPGCPSETVGKEQEFTEATEKLQSPVVNKAKKNTKEKVKTTNIPEPLDSQAEQLCPPVDHAVPERLVHRKPIKKQSRVKQAYSEKSDAMDVKPQDTAGEVTTDSKETPSKGKTKSSPKTLKVKKLNAVKHRMEVNKKKTPVKPGRKVAKAVKETRTEDHQEQSSDGHGQGGDPALKSGKKTRKGKQKKLPVLLEESSSAESQVNGKRQRRPPGQWWMSSSLDSEGADVTEHQHPVKKLKPSQKQSKQSPARRKKAEESAPVSPSSPKRSRARGKMPRRNKSGGQVRAKPRKTKASPRKSVQTDAEQMETQEEKQQEASNSDPLHSTPVLRPPRGPGRSSGNQMFEIVHPNTSAEETPPTSSTSAQMCREPPSETGSDKRRRKVPCDWWVVGNPVDEVAPLPPPQQVKPVKGRKKTQPSKASGLGTPISGNVTVSSKPAGGAPGPSRRVKPASSKKACKRSLAPLMDGVTVEPPAKASREVGGLSSRQEVSERRECSPHAPPEEAQDASRTDAGEPSGVEGGSNNRNHSANTSKVIRSGPSSMIQLDDYRDNDTSLPSSRFNTLLSVSDLCAPPLKPLVLQPKDKGNLSEWFRSLWSAESGADITPDHFDWFFYQGRAFGIHVDLNSGTLCSGKMILGSYMKKPLWVDHSATTVFHLLTSSVNVVIDGCGSRFHPAQAFEVPCGQAYSIQNVSAQPAVLYFTRMYLESSD